MASASFQRRWALANSVAFLIGYLPYTPIAHGLTGSHGRQLTLSQLIAHSLAMSVAGTVVATAQRKVLRPYVNVGWSRVPVAVLAFIVAFWLGYYQRLLPGQYLDMDILFGFTALGCALWLGSFRVRENSGLSVVWAVLAFTLGCAAGQLLAVAILLGLGVPLQALRSSMFVHAFYFETVAISTGVVGGALSGRFLTKALPVESQS